MTRKKQTIVLAFIIVLLFTVSCTSSDVKEVKKTTKIHDEAENISDESQEKADETNDIGKVEEQTSFSLGETLNVDNLYSLTILAVNETKDRNQFSDQEVSQVLIIDYMFENLSSDKKDIYISDSNFKFVDQHGNMCNTYPVTGVYEAKSTPIGARSFGSMAIGTIEDTDTIKLLYYDNMFDSKSTIEFELNINESVEIDFSGEMPNYENVFHLGEEVEVSRSDGSYTIMINNVRKTTERNQFSEKEPADVYIIDYTYNNKDIEESIYISDSNFKIIDSNGNIGFTYPAGETKFPQETIKGAKTTADMAFGTHTSGNSIILCYVDNMFNSKSDFYFLISDIN